MNEDQGQAYCLTLMLCIKTNTRYAGAAEKVLLMRRKRKPPMIE